ncbi:MAG TPA: signal transduction protein [Lachnospiraceae bacterium]|nr:signal transduction protein [Lachnospiraceae bacterium]
MRGKLKEKIIRYLNSLKLNRKLNLLFTFCVLIPMAITDAVILGSVYRSVEHDVEAELSQTASAVEYTLQNQMEYPASIAHNLYKSRVIEEFLNEPYVTPYDYYDAYFRLESGLMFDSTMGIQGARVSIFADNPTILNGSGFYRMDSVEDAEWFKELYSGEENRRLTFDYGTGMDSDTKLKRRILILVKMDMGAFRGCKKALRLDLDFSDFEDALQRLEIEDKVYVCDGDTLIFTNKDSSGELEPFEKIPDFSKNVFKKDITLYGKDLTIYIESKENEAKAFLVRNGGVFVLLMALNIALLLVMMYILERTMITRIKYLEDSFGIMDEDKMMLIRSIGGEDEIAGLIKSYNKMASRMNELVNTVYKDRLKEQEMDIAKQNAELLALHSQINPHFLFNALESVRMHSLLKNEKETAEMVGRLAVMERTYVNWGDDEISIRKEMDFVDAYLALQKYRFGDRLSYQLNVDEDCEIYTIPKLTIVTFVENACEHGVEKKSAPGWIFVRVFKNEGMLNIEIEDTGVGMNIGVVNDITERVKNVSIQSMHGKSHVGIMNAFLRLKMVTGDKAEFKIESERGVGTVIRLGIPLGENE